MRTLLCLSLFLIICPGVQAQAGFRMGKTDYYPSEINIESDVRMYGLTPYSGSENDKIYRIWSVFQVVELIQSGGSDYRGQLVSFVDIMGHPIKRAFNKAPIPGNVVSKLMVQIFKENMETLPDHSVVEHSMDVVLLGDRERTIFEVCAGQNERRFEYWSPESMYSKYPESKEYKNVCAILAALRSELGFGDGTIGRPLGSTAQDRIMRLLDDTVPPWSIMTLDYSTRPLLSADEMPEFPGDVAARELFLQKNLRYPKLARERGIQGQVVIQCVVETDGTLSNITVLRSLDAACDAEAIRLAHLMPRWKPGKQNGKVVRVQVSLPIRFKLY